METVGAEAVVLVGTGGMIGGLSPADVHHLVGTLGGEVVLCIHREAY